MAYSELTHLLAKTISEDSAFTHNHVLEAVTTQCHSLVVHLKHSMVDVLSYLKSPKPHFGLFNWLKILILYLVPLWPLWERGLIQKHFRGSIYNFFYIFEYCIMIDKVAQCIQLQGNFIACFLKIKMYLIFCFLNPCSTLIGSWDFLDILVNTILKK